MLTSGSLQRAESFGYPRSGIIIRAKSGTAVMSNNKFRARRGQRRKKREISRDERKNAKECEERSAKWHCLLVVHQFLLFEEIGIGSKQGKETRKCRANMR